MSSLHYNEKQTFALSFLPINSVFLNNKKGLPWNLLNYRDMHLIALFLKYSYIFHAPVQTIDAFSVDYEKSFYNSTVFLYFSLKSSTFFNFIILNSGFKKNLKSTDSLIPAHNWLEREMSEMVGVFFSFKNDTRNLLLEYTNVFKPLLKNFPSFGYFELFFDTLKQHMIHKNTSLQL